MAWYPFYVQHSGLERLGLKSSCNVVAKVVVLIFLCVEYFSYSAWDWTSFMVPSSGMKVLVFSRTLAGQASTRRTSS